MFVLNVVVEYKIIYLLLVGENNWLVILKDSLVVWKI